MEGLLSIYIKVLIMIKFKSITFLFVPLNLFFSFLLLLSLTHAFFRSVLFNLKMFEYFLISPILISNLILKSEASNSYYFNSFIFVKVYFMTQNMIHLGEYSMITWKEHIFFRQVEYSVYVNNIRLIDNIFQFSLSLLIISCLIALSNPENRVLKLSRRVVNVYFSFQFYHFLFNVFWSFLIGRNIFRVSSW